MRTMVGLLSLVLLACGDSTRPDPGDGPCPDDLVAVTVTGAGSAAPSFSWTPTCPVAFIEVRAIAPEASVVWSVSGRLLNVIGSGVTYGQLPFGTEIVAGPVALVPATTYEVRVARAVEGEDGPELGGGGSAQFSR